MRFRPDFTSPLPTLIRHSLPSILTIPVVGAPPKNPGIAVRRHEQGTFGAVRTYQLMSAAIQKGANK
jgi:hypothetical protein